MRIVLTILDRKTGDKDAIQNLELEVFSDMTLATLRESIQAETKVPTEAQQIYHNGKLLKDVAKTMEELQIADGDMLAIHVLESRSTPSQQTQATRPATRPAQSRVPAQADPETLRLRLLGDPATRQQLQYQNPELAAAADDPARFASAYRDSADRDRRERVEKQRLIEELNSDPNDFEKQTQIEEMIRQEQVLENLQNAMEHNPEFFGRVNMLYVHAEVNGHKLKAFVDSGAQATIMSSSCAEKCGIMRLVDKRFSGVARGVGTAKLLGRVHTAQIKIGTLHLPCSFNVLDHRNMDLLLGLDMLKRYQATIECGRDRLIIHGEEIPFLGEAEIPKEDGAEPEPTVSGPNGTVIGQKSGTVYLPSGSSAAGPSSAPVAGLSSSSSSQPSTNSKAPMLASSVRQQASTQSASAEPQVSAEHVKALVNMGAEEEQAIQALRSTDGDVDMAASLIFFD